MADGLVKCDIDDGCVSNCTRIARHISLDHSGHIVMVIAPPRDMEFPDTTPLDPKVPPVTIRWYKIDFSSVTPVSDALRVVLDVMEEIDSGYICAAYDGRVVGFKDQDGEVLEDVD